MPKSWALLIGVGVNIDRRNLAQGGAYTDTSLPGAVPDIVAAEACLNSAAEGVEIIKLTVSKSADYDASRCLIESPENLPTQANVIAALLTIIPQGERGDHVYIHFSGHGTKMSVEKTDLQAVALVLFDSGEFGASYLHGERLRKAVEKMTEKGIFVTIVLDCCFSGSVLRHGTQHETARFMEYNPAVDAVSDSPLFSQAADFRGATMKHSNILDPDKYTIMTACSPGETAREGLMEGGRRRGALSYFLYNSISVLRKRGVRVSHVSLHQHLCASFRSRLSTQTPMLLGKSQESFWKHLIPQFTAPLVSVYYEASKNRLVLAAGQAHGVHQGDEYAVYPYYTDATQRARSELNSTVQVVKVDCLTSELKAFEDASRAFTDHDTSWEAKLISSYSAQKVHVDLGDLDIFEKQQGNQPHHPYLELFSTSTEISDTTAYRVVQDEQLNYSIRNAADERVAGLPLIPSRREGAEQSLLNVLGHIASFKYFETVDNPDPDTEFEREFSLDISSAEADGYVTVNDGNEFHFKFTNLGRSRKYLTIFMLKSSWEIVNLTYDLGDDHWIEIPGSTNAPGRQEHILPVALRMEMSDEKYLHEEDAFKFFITSGPTVFPQRILPKINEDGLRDTVNQVALAVEKLKMAKQGDLRNKESWSVRTALVRTMPSERARVF